MVSAGRRNDRRLSQEEAQLWRFITRHDKRMHAVSQEDMREASAPLGNSVSMDKSASIQNQQPIAIMPATGGSARTPLVCGQYAGVDSSTARRVQRGRYPIDVTLDLHGKSRERAAEVVFETIRAAQQKGLRCLLIITGRGRSGKMSHEAPEGVLRSLLPLWLNDDSIRPYVIAFDEAAPRHGGGGAFYVLLRRQRREAQP